MGWMGENAFGLESVLGGSWMDYVEVSLGES